jgi:hypothetical protein
MTTEVRPILSDPGEEEKPLQFRLLDLFGLMTVVALVAAVAAPVLRSFESEFRNLLFVIAAMQLAIIVTTIVYYAKKRKALCDRSGIRLGVGLSGHASWRYWPVVKSVLTGLIVVAGQVAVAFKVAHDLAQHGFVNGPFSTLLDRLPLSYQTMEIFHNVFWLIDLLYFVQLAWFVGYVFSRTRWRVYSNTIEFFQNGISRKGTDLTSWERIEFRPSTFFSDRIVLVVQASDTIVVQVSSSLRDRILSVVSGGSQAPGGN